MKVIVIKIGTKLLTTASGKLDLNSLRQLVNQISSLQKQPDTQCIVVSSGSIICGAEALQMTPDTIPEKQAAASVGQLLLLKEYHQFFALNHLSIGQILLTRDILDSQEKTKNVTNTIQTLLSKDIIPIINENDSVATEEIQFGDNDMLSAIVAQLTEAEQLVLLTDQDGLFDKNPSEHNDATLIEHVDSVSQSLIDSAPEALDNKGRGGMKSKLIAAQYAAKHGVTTVIANGYTEGILSSVIEDKSGGTWFTV